MDNPFSIHTYPGPDRFCDRNAELSRLLEMFDSRRFGLLYSMRRLGKTGLVHHFQHFLRKRKGVITVYCDVQNTRNDAEFATKLITAVVRSVEKSRAGITRRIGQFFTSLRPVLTFDPVTQMPELQLSIESGKDVQSSMSLLMSMLGELPQKVQISLDEFQQIAHYPETVIDATLRGYLDKAPNVHFLFCGSQRHLLLSLFTGAQKPFFGAVEQMQLSFLDHQVYADFIQEQFRKGKQKIDHEVIDEILKWTRGHTFYTQYFCNKLYARHEKVIDLLVCEQIRKEILFSFEPGFLSLESVLSKNQLKLIKAIAKEESIASIGSADFLTRYGIAQSTAQQASKVLLEKEILYEDLTQDGSRYFVYDPFFSRWLETR